MPPTEITLAQVMKKAGYATGMVGKWHLGMHDKFHAHVQRGFDEYFGFLFGANSYIDPKQPGRMTEPLPPKAVPSWPRSDAESDLPQSVSG